MPPGAVYIIVNPISGQGPDSRFLAQLRRHLTLRGFAAEVMATERPRHGRELARSVPDDARCIVSIGGDGTHREILSGLLGRPVPVCVVPSGTENVLGRTFRLLPTLRDTLRRIQSGRPVAIDIGLANDYPFVMLSGTGFDAAITDIVHRNRRGRILREAYYGPTARLWWRYPFPALAVTVDGRPLVDDAGFVLVANTPVYADRLRMAARAVGDDGLLDVVCFRTRSRWRILELYLCARAGRHLAHPLTTCAQGRRITVTCAEAPAPTQVDGDAVMTTPVTYTVMPKAVRLLV
ncbi:MAG: diacylglycerol kinase family lipid kinase [Planctomycetes bacterium]|nr:diacylglycerol kinase family lipid kinase [Planctomycetota bacterium]